MWWWYSRPIHEPTTSADTVVVYRSPTVAETALVYRVERALSGDHHTTEASAEAVGSWIGQLSHRRMPPGGLSDAQSLVRRPHRLVRRFRCVLGKYIALLDAALERSQRPYTSTASAEAVGS